MNEKRIRRLMRLMGLMPIYQKPNTMRRLHLGDSEIGSDLIQDQQREVILSRRALTDRQWAIIEPLVPGQEGDRGRTGADNRLFLDAILWLARGASPWRDSLPGSACLHA